ncbi:MAG: hypothetical protein FJ265_08610 [Planctomycetes bacterium]|nr:hypothetical protein [Planctomycetota bacterium]
MLRNRTLFRAIARAMPKSHALARLLGPQGLRVALWHHLAPTEHGLVAGLGITTPPDLFAAHLDRLARDYDVVSLDDVLAGEMPRRPLLLTFDDPFRSVLEVAVPLLRQRGLPAVHFVNAGCVASGLPLPEHLLNHAVAAHGFEAVRRALGMDAARCRCPADVVARLDLAGWRMLSTRLSTAFGIDAARLARASGLYLTPADVGALAAAGVEIGNHTAEHLPGRVLDAAAAHAEIVVASQQLARWAGRPVRAYAQPFGSAADVTPAVRRAIAAAGTEVAFLVQGCANGVAEAPAAGAVANGRAVQVFDRVGFGTEAVGELFVNLEILPRLRAARSRLRGGSPRAFAAET